MAKTVMGYWDCPVCSNAGIRGDVMNCPSCGRARGDVQFYLKNGADQGTREAGDTADLEYLSEEKAQEIGKNPDWYCSFCNSLNRDHAQFCGNCGASRADSESNYFDQLKKRQEAEAQEKAAQAASMPQPKRKSRLPLLIVILAVIVGLAVYMGGSNRASGLKVVSLSWSRSIPIGENVEHTGSDWAIPAGGEEISQEQRIHHYDQVLDHYESVEVERSRRVIDYYETYYTYSDNGNGTFEQVEHERPVYKTEYYTETESRPVYRSVPRYQTWYTFRYWQWEQTRVAEASGRDHEAAWPETNLTETEVEGPRRQEKYTFTVEDKDGKQETWTLSEADWRNISEGDSLIIQTPRSGGDSWIVDEKGNQLMRVSKY